VKSGVSAIVSGIIITCALLFLTPLFESIPQVCFQVVIADMSHLRMFFPSVICVGLIFFPFQIEVLLAPIIIFYC
jgi:MFS superfamily sulfate permease-like transporter